MGSMLMSMVMVTTSPLIMSTQNISLGSQLNLGGGEAPVLGPTSNWFR